MEVDGRYQLSYDEWNGSIWATLRQQNGRRNLAFMDGRTLSSHMYPGI